MDPNPVKLAWAVLVGTLVGALPSCGGKQVLDLGGDAGSGDDGGAGAEADVAFVLGSAVPCFYGVCSPPEVCCQSNASPTLPGAIACEAASLCHDVAIGCTATTCPAGSVCCANAWSTNTERTAGWTRCVEASTCPVGEQLVCTQILFGSAGQGVGCPAGESCYDRGEEYAVCGPPIDDGGED